jgi:hypothetical protein
MEMRARHGGELGEGVQVGGAVTSKAAECGLIHGVRKMKQSEGPD